MPPSSECHPIITASPTSALGVRWFKGRVRFHYLIAQCFCEAAPTAALAAGDDALDARWFTLDDVANAGGDVAGNCWRILARAEALFAAGLLPGDGEGRP